MSRGLGRIERRLLELLSAADELTAPQLATSLTGGRPSRSVLSSVRRALAKLATAGVVLRRPRPGGGIAWCTLTSVQRRQHAAKAAEHEQPPEQNEQQRGAEDAIQRRIDEAVASKTYGLQWALNKMNQENIRLKRELKEGGPVFGSGPAIEMERLAKVLGMLGSSKDGEALNAARLAENERKRLGLTWDQILSVAPRRR